MFQKNDTIKLDNDNKYVVYNKYENYLLLININNQEEVIIVKEENGELEEVIDQNKINELLKKLTKI